MASPGPAHKGSRPAGAGSGRRGLLGLGSAEVEGGLHARARSRICRDNQKQEVWEREKPDKEWAGLPLID